MTSGNEIMKKLFERSEMESLKLKMIGVFIIALAVNYFTKAADLSDVLICIGTAIVGLILLIGG